MATYVCDCTCMHAHTVHYIYIMYTDVHGAGHDNLDPSRSIYIYIAFQRHTSRDALNSRPAGMRILVHTAVQRVTKEWPASKLSPIVDVYQRDGCVTRALYSPS